MQIISVSSILVFKLASAQDYLDCVTLKMPFKSYMFLMYACMGGKLLALIATVVPSHKWLALYTVQCLKPALTVAGLLCPLLLQEQVP